MANSTVGQNPISASTSFGLRRVAKSGPAFTGKSGTAGRSEIFAGSLSSGKESAPQRVWVKCNRTGVRLTGAASGVWQGGVAKSRRSRSRSAYGPPI